MTATLGPNLAGTWYPAGAEALDLEVRRMLQAEPAPAPGGEPVIALIQPHAGYRYSGQVAAAGFRHVQGARYRRVLLIGPSHHEFIPGAAVPEAAGYATPLGTVDLDAEALADLEGVPDFSRSDGPFRMEHCLEIELPFLQAALEPGWKLLPVLIGHDLSGDRGERIAAALGRWAGPGTLVVASSDFTHYGEGFRYVPFRDNVRERLDELDRGALDRIVTGDREGFRSYVARTGATICGRNAIDLLMRMVPGDARAELLRYDTSGNLTSDWSHSVSYAAVAFRAPGGLGTGDRALLLRVARDAIRSSLEGGEPDRRLPPDCPEPLQAKRATFVSLKTTHRGGGRLRGCIGNLEPREPLYLSVVGNACSAAFSDSRFPELTRDELDRVRIEISVLTPMRPVSDAGEIRPGKDGVQLRAAGRTAVFLPQVAAEQGWDRTALLENLCRKAGLESGAWKEAELQVFQAEVFGESEPGAV